VKEFAKSINVELSYDEKIACVFVMTHSAVIFLT